MTSLRIRKQSSRFQFPANVMRIMRPQIGGAMDAVRFHYARRHIAEHRRAARNWADEVRRIDANSGYSTALAQSLGIL